MRHSTGSLSVGYPRFSSYSERFGAFGETVTEPLRPYSFNGRVSDRYPRGFGLDRGCDPSSGFSYRNSDSSLGQAGSYSALPSVGMHGAFCSGSLVGERQSISPGPKGAGLGGRSSEETGLYVTFFALATSVQHGVFLRALGELATLFDSLVSVRKHLMIVAYWTSRSESELMNSVCEQLGNGSNLVTVVGSFTEKTLQSIHDYVQ